MSFFKIITVLLVAAIANPFCCCNTGLAAMMTGSAVKDISDEPFCCEETNSSGDHQKGNEDHSPSDCSHQYEKDSQINQTTDSGHTFLKLSSHVVELLPVLEYGIGVNAIPLRKNSSYEKDTLPPNTAISKVYCVYLL
jgi:hypothetical protein